MITQEVTLPSGLKVTIKKPGVLALHAVYGVLPSVAGESGLTGPPPAAADNLEATIKLVCRCCIAPRFSDADPLPAGTQSIDDLDWADFGALSAAVGALAGFAQAEAEVSPLSPTGIPS